MHRSLLVFGDTQDSFDPFATFFKSPIPFYRLAYSYPLTLPYELRTYQPGDEKLLAALIIAEGWPFDTAQWHDYQDRIVPNGLFLLWHTPSQTLVATGGAIHNPSGSR